MRCSSQERVCYIECSWDFIRTCNSRGSSGTKRLTTSPLCTLIHCTSHTKNASCRHKKPGDKKARQENSEESKEALLMSVDHASKVLNKAVKEGPDYACTCCHWLMYRQTVLGFKVDKYRTYLVRSIWCGFARRAMVKSQWWHSGCTSDKH